MLTVYKISTIFNDLNKKHFNGNLPMLPIRISNRSKRTLGSFQFSFKRASQTYTNRIFLMIANVPEHANDAVLIHTIMHEMCHYALYMKYRDTVPPRNMIAYNGHNVEFRRMMERFGYDGGAKHPLIGQFRKEVSPVDFFKNIPPVLLRPMVVPSPVKVSTPSNLYKVLSSGKVGTFLRESTIYGKKHIVLTIEGNLFPFTTPMDNVQPLTIAA